MLVVGSGATGGAIRRVFRADRFALLGTAFGYSEVRASLLVEKRFDMLEARAVGTSRAEVLMRVEKRLAGAVSGRSLVSATIAPHVFDGVMQGRSTVASALLVKKNLVAWPTGQASTAATLLTIKELMGRAQGYALPNPRLTVEKILGAEPAVGTSSASAALLIEKVLVSAAIGNAEAVATVLIEKQLAAATSGLTEAAATILVEKVLGVAATGSTELSGRLRKDASLGGHAVGTGSMTGQERIWKALAGSASGLAIVAAEMEPPLTYRRTESDDVRSTESGDVRLSENDINPDQA